MSQLFTWDDFTEQKGILNDPQWSIASPKYVFNIYLYNDNLETKALVVFLWGIHLFSLDLLNIHVLNIRLWGLIFTVTFQPCLRWLVVRLKKPQICPDGHQFFNLCIGQPVECFGVCVPKQGPVALWGGWCWWDLEDDGGNRGKSLRSTKSLPPGGWWDMLARLPYCISIPKPLLGSVLRQTAKNLALIQAKVARHGSDDTISLVDLNNEVGRALLISSLTSASRVWTSDRLAMSPSIYAMDSFLLWLFK